MAVPDQAFAGQMSDLCEGNRQQQRAATLDRPMTVNHRDAVALELPDLVGRRRGSRQRRHDRQAAHLLVEELQDDVPLFVHVVVAATDEHLVVQGGGRVFETPLQRRIKAAPGLRQHQCEQVQPAPRLLSHTLMHERPFAMDPADEIVALQRRHGLPYRAAGDSQLFGQFQFGGQGVARPQPPRP